MSLHRLLSSWNLADDDGVPVRLGDTWKHRPVVLAFVRHFGCVFSREQVNDLKRVLPELQARGAELVIVGNGKPEEARAFREDLALDCTILVDPSLTTYRLAGLRRGLAALLVPRFIRNKLRALRDGYRDRKVQGDPWQQGGVFVIAPRGANDEAEVVYSHVSEVAGDHPAPSDVVDAVGRAPAAAA